MTARKGTAGGPPGRSPRGRRTTPPPSLTIAEAAEVLGRSPRLVRKLLEAGRLTVVDGTPVRVTVASVDEELGKRAARTTTSPPRSPSPVVRLDGDALAAIVTAATREAYRQGAEDTARAAREVLDAYVTAARENDRLQAVADRDRARAELAAATAARAEVVEVEVVEPRAARRPLTVKGLREAGRIGLRRPQ